MGGRPRYLLVTVVWQTAATYVYRSIVPDLCRTAQWKEMSTRVWLASNIGTTSTSLVAYANNVISWFSKLEGC